MDKIRNLTLEELQRTVDSWIRTTGVRYFTPLTNTAVLAEETGEVARLMARIYGDQSFKAGEVPGFPGGEVTDDFREPIRAKLADELADVIWVVAAIANQTGCDLAEAFSRNLEKKTLRDATRHRDNPKLHKQ